MNSIKAMYYNLDFNLRLRILLEANGISRKKIANALQVTESVISSWFLSKCRIKIHYIEKILNFLAKEHVDISKEWLLNNEGSIPSSINAKYKKRLEFLMEQHQIKKGITRCSLSTNFKLKILLSYNKITNKKFGAFLGVSSVNVGLWFSLKTKIPLHRIDKILEFFKQENIQIDKNWLLYNEGSPPDFITPKHKEAINKLINQLMLSNH